jgi:hypothetical protein
MVMNDHTMPMSCKVLSAGILLANLLSAPAGAQEAALPAGHAALVAHRAVYDLTLGEARGSSSVDSIRGRIVYDFSGSACRGYVLKFRQVTEIGTGGGSNISDLRSSTVEDDAGKTFRFTSQNYVNDKLDADVDGKAERAAGGSVGVSLDKPASTAFQLPEGVIFPTGQTKGIVEAAIAGRSVFESKIYDGSDGGRKVYSTLAVIGHKIPSDKPREGAARNRPELDGIDRWPVTISYFDPSKSSGGEETPVYSISFDLYANGISGNIRLDYGDFTLKGEMTSLEFLPQPACN